MIDIETLSVGQVVQLVSGSPFMTVRGFKPIAPPSSRRAPRSHVTCILWGHRLGFIERDFTGAELRFPSPRAAAPEADETAEEAEAQP